MPRINLNPGNSQRSTKYHRHNYCNKNARENLVAYIFDKEKTPANAIGVRNLPNDVNTIPTAMKAVASIFGQEIDKKRKAEHFVLSLSKEESSLLGVDGLRALSERYCDSFSDQYQIAYAVHENKPEQLHTHFILNPVSFKTGNRMHKSMQFLKEQRNIVLKLYDTEIKAARL